MTPEQLKHIHSLHHEAVLISQNLHRQEFLMIEILQRIDAKKVYRVLGFKSLYQYATVALKLSESRAYAFILVARRASGLSKMQEALKSGELSLSKAKRITSVIGKENEEHWLKLAKVSSQRVLERAVAKENPKACVDEGMRFLSENTLEFKAAIGLDTEKLLKRVQDIISQSERRHVSFDETLRMMAQSYLDKQDPVVKAQRILSKKIKGDVATANSNGTIKNKTQDLSFRKPLPAELKHQVYLRDQGRCQKEECHDSRWIDVHHIKPVSQGGLNILENLITLCSGHHRLEHT
jgi:hypothetical protein